MQDVNTQRSSLDGYSSLERILGLERADSLFGQLDKIRSLERVSRQRITVTEPATDDSATQQSHYYSHTESVARLEMRARKPFSQPVKAPQKSARDYSLDAPLKSRCVQYINNGLLSPRRKQTSKKERAPHKIRFITSQAAENKDPAEQAKRRKNPFSSTLFTREEDSSTLLQDSASKHYYAPYYK